MAFHPERIFQEKHLPSYHPHAATMPPHIQKEIIEAHNTFSTHVQTLKRPQNPTACAWPFYYNHHETSIGTSIVMNATLPSLLSTIGYVPTKARHENFTLNVLARLHPTWMELLDQLTPLILATRIIPQRLKTTGRVLIDKPNSTDKRPISLLHAYDSYLDNIVNSRLSPTVEALDILDSTIAAYRKGHSCTNLTLDHLIAIQDTLRHKEFILAQLDEDKEKYFDRLTMELQLLPLHLMGFLPGGYIEWITESLDDLHVTTSTPFGNALSRFYCGVRQGSALACTIANLVAWLTASIWIDQEPTTDINPPQTPTPSPNPNNGHTPPVKGPHPIDASANATLTKHSYCDDSSKYIIAANVRRLIHLLSDALRKSGAMSIVTKLSINAKKSTIRITNAPTSTRFPHFYYTAWNHTSRTVQTNPVTTINLAHHTKPSRMFGTYINPDATTSTNSSRLFPIIKAKRHALQQHHISNSVLALQYPLLVTSVAGFNTISMAYTIEDAITDDILSLPCLRKKYTLHPILDPPHQIYTSHTALGYNFQGSLTAALLNAVLRELFVVANTSHPAHLTSTATRIRAAIFQATHMTKHKYLTYTTPNGDIHLKMDYRDTHITPPPNQLHLAIHQAASTGIYLMDASAPTIALALMIIATYYPQGPHPLGTVHINAPATLNPFQDIINPDNTNCGPDSVHHRHLINTSMRMAAEIALTNHPFHEHDHFLPTHHPPTLPIPHQYTIAYIVWPSLLPSTSSHHNTTTYPHTWKSSSHSTPHLFSTNTLTPTSYYSPP
jgi:hypothetical protein